MSSADDPLLSIVLTPHRSLTPRGFRIVMGLIGGAMLATGVVFFLLGAWPVLGFMGLDILAIYWAFRVSFRSGRTAQEIHLTRDALTVRDVAEDGAETETRFNPYWARLEIVRSPEYGIVRMQLVSHGVRLEIGRFLPRPEREDVAIALSDALARAKAATA